MAPVVWFRNKSLSDADTGGQTSTVGEPSVANNGREILVTGNWYATKSLDNGQTWSHMSPYNTLPPPDGAFCCDQTALYDPSRDLTFWILQYTLQNNTNTLRVAIKRGDTLGNNDWSWRDFRPETVNGAWGGEWFDYNHAAISNNFLYVGTNAFTPAEDFTRSVILRLPLDELASGGALPYSYFATTNNFSLRCVQGARETMYFASHDSNTQLRVFSWPENGLALTVDTVTVAQWSGQPPYAKDWLGNCDPRITGAWVANGEIGLMWSVNQRPNRPNPYVRVVRIDEQTKDLIDEPDIWSGSTAFAYPDACPNDRGHVGITLFRGDDKPDHLVGIRDDFGGWDLRVTSRGTHAPAVNRWGDYLTCRRHSPDGLTWIATGYTLRGGNSRDDVVPRIVHFGRERDRRAVQRWQNA